MLSDFTLAMSSQLKQKGTGAALGEHKLQIITITVFSSYLQFLYDV